MQYKKGRYSPNQELHWFLQKSMQLKYKCSEEFNGSKAVIVQIKNSESNSQKKTEKTHLTAKNIPPVQTQSFKKISFTT